MFRRSTVFLLLSMPVNLNQYRGAVGVFNCKYSMVKNYRYHYSQYSFKLTLKRTFSPILVTLYAFCIFTFYFCNIAKYHLRINTSKKFICSMICIYIYFIWLIFILLICSGDIETNPGPKSKYCQSFLYVTGT